MIADLFDPDDHGVEEQRPCQFISTCQRHQSDQQDSDSAGECDNPSQNPNEDPEQLRSIFRLRQEIQQERQRKPADRIQDQRIEQQQEQKRNQRILPENGSPIEETDSAKDIQRTIQEITDDFHFRSRFSGHARQNQESIPP